MSVQVAEYTAGRLSHLPEPQKETPGDALVVLGRSCVSATL